MASFPSSDDSFFQHSSETWYPARSSPTPFSSQQLPPLLPFPRVPESSLSSSSRSSTTTTNSSSSNSSINSQDLLISSSRPHSSFGTKDNLHDQLHPDGGLHAWLTILSSALLLFCVFGLQTSIGLFQLHLSLHQLSAYSPSVIAWIPSLYIFTTLVSTGYFGVLFDRFGAQYLLGAGSAGYFTTFFLLARCTRYWHFILCLGLLGGVSSAAIVTVSQGTIAHWFREKHGMASAIAMLGAALGGVVFPLILNPLMERVGWVWAMQGLGFIMGGFLVVGNVLCKSRLRATCTSSRVDLRVFLDKPFLWLTAAVFGFEILLISGIGLIPAYAYKAGYGNLPGYYLVMTLSIGSTLGRLIPSYYSDTIGRFNTLLISSLATLLAMLILWLPLGETSLVALYFSTLFYGFGTGSFVSLSMACVGQICAGRDIRKWILALDGAVSVATLIAIPVSSAFLQLGERAMVGFLIAVLTWSIAALCVARWLSLGGKWVWRAKI